jgi:hypothetical protein
MDDVVDWVKRNGPSINGLAWRRLDLSGSRLGQVAGCGERGSHFYAPMKCGI